MSLCRFHSVSVPAQVDIFTIFGLFTSSIFGSCYWLSDKISTNCYPLGVLGVCVCVYCPMCPRNVWICSSAATMPNFTKLCHFICAIHYCLWVWEAMFAFCIRDFLVVTSLIQFGHSVVWHQRQRRRQLQRGRCAVAFVAVVVGCSRCTSQSYSIYGPKIVTHFNTA